MVWRLRQGNWERQFAFWGKGVYERLPIIPVILSGGHYFGLQKNQPKQALPEAWAKDHTGVLIVQSCVDENIGEISKGIRDGVADGKKPKDFENQIGQIAVHGFSTPFRKHPEQFDGDAEWLLRACTPCNEEPDLLRTCRSEVGPQEVTKSIKRNRAVQWTCPVCSLEMEVRKGHAKVTRHIRRTHQLFYEENVEKNRNCGYRGNNATSGIGLRELLSPLQFLPLGPKAYFKRPCSKGLEDKPRSRHLLVLSKKAHLIRDCEKAKKNQMKMPILQYTRLARKKQGLRKNRVAWIERSKVFANRAQSRAVARVWLSRQNMPWWRLVLILHLMMCATRLNEF